MLCGLRGLPAAGFQDAGQGEFLTKNPPIRALIEILSDCKMFDDSIERDSFWISGTYLGQAFTVQFNYDGIGKIAQDKILEIVGAIK